jgi:hypothetical protein
MTVLDQPQAAPPGGTVPPPGGAPENVEPPASDSAAPRQRSPVYQVIWAAVLILSVTLLGFALYVGRRCCCPPDGQPKK